MFQKEAQILGEYLGEIPARELSPLVNIGSGSSKFRERNRPWVDRMIFAPLRKRKVEITHVDIETRPGVDLVADILTDDGFENIRRIKPKMVLLTNVLEHVHEPRKFAQRCLDMLEPDGRLLITVPRSYPHHGGIDTMLRPTPEEIAAFVPTARILNAEIVPMEYHWHEIARDPRKLMARKLKWLLVPYKLSVVVLAPGAVAPASQLRERSPLDARRRAVAR